MDKKITFILIKSSMLSNYKNITDITYNYLNLPSVITVSNKGPITYTYDAAGNKLKKVTQENNATVPFNGISNNPSDPSFEAANSTKLYKLNSTGSKTGLGITLKVMAGDKIDIFGKSYYFQNTAGQSGNSQIPILDLLTGFLGTPLAPGATHGLAAADLNIPAGILSIQSLITNQNSQSNASPTRPKAFINVIFFDGQFKSYDYRVSMTGSNSIVKDHYSELQNITAGKNGYVYIYCSNESPVDVFFDNLQVVHTRGRILEETHYYPFGLTMAGISSKALQFGGAENRLKYNGIEFNRDLDLNSYEAFYRTLDPQLGRWWQMDPKPDYSHSPYSSMNNNPIFYSDFLGDTIIPTGTPTEIQKLTRALEFVSQTNPEDFAIVNNSSENVLIGIADLNPDRKNNSSKPNDNSTIRFGENEERVNNNGEFNNNLEARGGLEQNPDGSFSRLSYNDDGEMIKVNINEQDANKLIKIKDAVITIDVNLGKKDFMKTVAHEIGHGAHTFQNRAQSFFYRGDPKLKGHDQGNPSGIRAVNAETQFLQNYNKVKKLSK